MFRQSLRWIVLALVLMWSPDVFAQSALNKLGRGVVNTALGWTQLPLSFVKCHDAEIMGVSAGGFCVFTVGFIGAVAREVFGVIEVATFPLRWPKTDYSSMYGEAGCCDYPWSKGTFK